MKRASTEELRGVAKIMGISQAAVEGMINTNPVRIYVEIF
jgi:predicted transcriptional regulator